MLRPAGLAALAILGLAGCSSDRSDRAYYRTRYIPEDVESTYDPVQRAQWKGDPQVYELPAAAPDINGEARPRALCDKPGPQFKAQPMVGVHGEAKGTSLVELQPAGGMDSRPVPVGALEPLPGLAAGGQHGAPPAGVYTTTVPLQPMGGHDTRPRYTPGSGVTVIAAQPAGVQRSMEKTDYCLQPEAPTSSRR